MAYNYDRKFEILPWTFLKGNVEKKFKPLLNSIQSCSDENDQIVVLALCSLFNLNFKENEKFINYIFNLLTDESKSKHHIPCLYGIISYYTSYKNNEASAWNKELRLIIQSWKEYPKTENISDGQHDFGISFFDNKKNLDLNQESGWNFRKPDSDFSTKIPWIFIYPIKSQSFFRISWISY